MTQGVPRRVDPDVDLRVPADRSELTARPATVLGAIAVGGVLGALARAGVQAALPHTSTGFPWSTFAVNVTGCLLIGALMAVLGRRRVGPLVRPFLGVGVLGGFTTFSAYVVDVHRALDAGAAPTALAYLVATLVGGLLAVAAGDALATRLLARGPGRDGPPPGAGRVDGEVPR
ncbi:fluoride efflux transporter FluC [Micromonospora antibiotica]|uniref:Fluoride-specific ion channel FluC n=1 Tax=Micromonospora antibiotica TaxID=2807623 RepID=A0ABS3V5F0_9ACTN|nr:CrcB family protein [Micromonospora antibiotica]MBO4160852.1 CrcB family protein [Micromonospora antibiotica]